MASNAEYQAARQRYFEQVYREMGQQARSGGLTPTYGGLNSTSPDPYAVQAAVDAKYPPRRTVLNGEQRAPSGGGNYGGGYGGGGYGGGGNNLSALMKMAGYEADGTRPERVREQPQYGPYQQYGGQYGGQYPPGYVDPMSAEYQRMMNEANAANEARYEEGKKGYMDLRERVMGQVGSLGSYQRDDTNRAFNEKSENVKADLASRGLLGSTVLTSVQRGVERERNDAMRRVEDDIASRQVNADVSTTGSLLGFTERRNDVGPDYSQLIGLQQALGQGGYGSGAMGQGYAQAPGMGQPPMMTARGFNPGLAGGAVPMGPQPTPGGGQRGGMAFNVKQPWEQNLPGLTGNYKDRFEQYQRLYPGQPTGQRGFTPGAASGSRPAYPTIPGYAPPPTAPGGSGGQPAWYNNPGMLPPQMGGYPPPQMPQRPYGGIAARKSKTPVQAAAEKALIQQLQGGGGGGYGPPQRGGGGGGGYGGVPATYAPGGGGAGYMNPQAFIPQFNIPGQSYGMYGVGTGSTYNYTPRPDMTGMNEQYANRHNNGPVLPGFRQLQENVARPLQGTEINRPINPKYNYFV